MGSGNAHGENSVLPGAGEPWGAGQQNCHWVLLQALEGSCQGPEQDLGGVSSLCDVSELGVQFGPGKPLQAWFFLEHPSMEGLLKQVSVHSALSQCQAGVGAEAQHPLPQSCGPFSIFGRQGKVLAVGSREDVQSASRTGPAPCQS